jgi:HK97 family phage major capsid protein
VQAVNVGSIHRKTAMINATGQNQPLVPDQRVGGIITAPNRRLTIRDLLPQLTTTSNLVQFASENVFTNNAGPQFSSPNDKENVLKNESGITFTLSNAAVATIAHWIPASRQLLADASGLQAYIDSRLMYGLKLEEEEQILLGDGTGGNLSGIYTNGTTYNRGVSNDTRIDCLLKAMLQVAISEYTASGIVLNPIDWTAIQLIKDTTGRYIFADPQAMTSPRMWGLPVVATNTMSEGTFLVGAFDLAAAIWDREDATVRVAEQHDDFFVRNMVAILCEERMALTIYRTAAMVKGSLPATGT